MSQGYIKTYPPDVQGAESFATFPTKMRTNQSAMNTHHKGGAAPSEPEIGQCWIDDSTTPWRLKIYNGTSWVDVGVAISQFKETVDARGTAASVDARLSVFLNPDGTPKAGTSLNPSEWLDVVGTTTRVTASSFTIGASDLTAVFQVNRRVKMTPSAYGTVLSSSFAAGTTTVTLREATVPIDISAAAVAIISANPATTSLSALMLAYTGSGAGAVARSIATKLEDIVSVKDYGATGDGVTDDTAAIIAAIKTKRPLYWPAGVYVCASPINYNDLVDAGYAVDDVLWIGSGPFTTVIKYTGAGTFLTIGRAAPYYGPSVYMKHLSIIGSGTLGHVSTTIGGYTTTTNGTAGTNSTQTGLSLHSVTVPGPVFEGVRLKFFNIGLVTSNVYNFVIVNSVLQSNNVGWKCFDTTTLSRIWNSEIAGNAVGVWITGTGGQSLEIANCSIEANRAGAGVLSNGAEYVHVHHNLFTDNVDHVIHVGYNATSQPTLGVLSGLYVHHNHGVAVKLGDSVRLAEISDNAADDTTSYSIKNEYTDNAGLARRVYCRRNWSAFGGTPYAPYTKYDGTNAAEIIHGAPSTRVYNSANISLPDGIDVPLTFDSERWDLEGWHSTSVNTSRITVGRPGQYLITGHVSIEAGAVGYRQVAIRLNGTTTIAIQRIPAVSGASTAISVTTQYRLAAGDYVELIATQTSGGALNALTLANASPELSIQLME